METILKRVNPLSLALAVFFSTILFSCGISGDPSSRDIESAVREWFEKRGNRGFDVHNSNPSRYHCCGIAARNERLTDLEFIDKGPKQQLNMGRVLDYWKVKVRVVGTFDAVEGGLIFRERILEKDVVFDGTTEFVVYKNEYGSWEASIEF